MAARNKLNKLNITEPKVSAFKICCVLEDYDLLSDMLLHAFIHNQMNFAQTIGKELYNKFIG